MFQLENSIPELMGRGAFLFILFMVLFRLLTRRTGGELAPMDLVFLLLITEAASNSMGDYNSLADGTVIILTMLALNYITNRLSFALPWFERVMEHKPLQIIRDGQTIPRNLKKEMLTADELMGSLRLNGVDDIAQVRSAWVEGDGRLSVVKKEDDSRGEGAQRGSRAG